MPLSLNYAHTTYISIPYPKRTQTRWDWMTLHSIPLATHNRNFDRDYTEFEYSAKHNNQVLSFEHYLNGVLNPIQPIYITDGIWNEETYLFIRGELFAEDTYIYTRAEAQPPHYVYTRTGLDDQGVDYFVYLSNSDAALESQLQTYVEEFNPAGKVFEIKLY